MERGTLEFFQSGYDQLNDLVQKYYKALAERESHVQEEPKYKELRKQVYDQYSGKYGTVQRSESKRYTEEEIRQIRLELADTSPATILKRFFGFSKGSKEVYFELVGKLNGMIHYLNEQAKQDLAKSEELKEQIIGILKQYDAEMWKAREAAGCLADSVWDNYTAAETSDGSFLLGDVRRPFAAELPPEIAELSHAYRDKLLSIPFPWPMETPLRYICDYRKGSARQAFQEVYSLILQMLRLSPEYYMEFHMMDGAMSGENFGNLRNFQQVRKQDIVYLNHRVTQGRFQLAKLSLDGGAITEDLAALDRWMTLVAGELGEYKSLTEYNQAKGENAWIPYQTVIIDNFPAGFEDRDFQVLNRMITNGRTLGVFVILLNSVDRWDEMNQKSSYNKNVSIETVLTKDALEASVRFDFTGQTPKILQKEGTAVFVPQMMKSDRSAYISSAIDLLNEKKELDNNFKSWFDIEKPFGTLCSTNKKTKKDEGLRIPFAVNGRGKIRDFCLGKEMNAHGLICGGTGSGKSTLLHMLISSIVMNYTPNDVEIWLVDYKITEFNSYKINTPPHIRFIGLSKTADFSYAFIDKITEEMKRRQNIIAEANNLYNEKDGGDKKEGKKEKINISNITAYRKAYGLDSMRRLIVIIDEFHVMSQHAQAEPDYKIKLENILAEARALGIIMLFSDQAIVDGLRGLSDKGKKQIKARIALNNYMDELRETLGESDREKLRPLVHMNAGEVAVQTVEENEDKEEVATIERAKAIYIDDDWRDKVNEKARMQYDAENYVADCFDDSVVEPMVLADIQRWEDTMPAQHRDGSRDMQIYLGKPVNLGFALQFPLLRRSGNNIMSVSGSEEQQMRIIQAVLNSFQRQENHEILMMCDPYAGVYREYRPELHAYKKADSTVTIYESVSDICYQVNRLLAVTNHRDNEKKILVVWLGLDAIADVLSGAPPRKPKELDDLAKEKGIREEEKTEKTARKPEPKKEPPKDEAQLALDAAFASLFGADALASTKVNAIPEDEPEEDLIEEEELEDRYLYNARDDIARVIHIGPSRNVYHLVIYDTAAALRDFREVKTSEFRHKIAFAMSDNEAGDYLDRANLIRELPESMAYYHNGRAGAKFIPYRL